jgi:hypothetical protein
MQDLNREAQNRWRGGEESQRFQDFQRRGGGGWGGGERFGGGGEPLAALAAARAAAGIDDNPITEI